MESQPNPNAATPDQPTPRVPDRRRRAERLNRKSVRHGAVNTVIMPWVDVEADVDALRRGLAERDGNTFTVHGRVYVLEPGGRFFPRHGDGFHQLSRGAFRALALYNDPDLKTDPDRMLDLEGVSEEDRHVARRLKREMDEWRQGDDLARHPAGPVD